MKLEPRQQRRVAQLPGAAQILLGVALTCGVFHQEMCGALDEKIPKFSSSRVGEEKMKLNLGNSAHTGLSTAGRRLGCTKNRFLHEERVLQKG